ncbi:hypothetical protein ACTFTM_15260 [Micromonospora sp. RB23]
MSIDPSADGLSAPRENLLATWNPTPPQAQFSQWEKQNIDEIWAELRVVASANAWRSTSALCGQLIEAHLKQRLILGGRQIEAVNRAMLHRLIEMAMTDGIFTNEAKLGISGSIFAAKQIRNWSSHGSAWIRSPGENEGTIALTLLVCYSGWLFPHPASPISSTDHVVDDDARWDANVEAASLNTASNRIGFLLRVDDQDVEKYQAAMAQSIRIGTARSLLKLIRKARGSETGRTAATLAISGNFAEVVATAGRGRARNVLELAAAVTGLGLKNHARLLRACLPRDGEALAYYLSRSPAKFSTYLAAVRDADPKAFPGLLADPVHRQPLLTSLKRRVKRSEISFSTLIHVLRSLPPSLAAEVLTEVQPEIRAWLADQSPLTAANFLKLATRRPICDIPGLTPDDVVDILHGRIRTESSQFRLIAFRLYSLHLCDHPAALRLFEHILDNVGSCIDSNTSQLLIWDICQYTKLEERAVGASQKLAEDCALAWPARDRLSILGLLHSVESSPPYLASREDALTVSYEVEWDRWQLFRVTLALARSDKATRAAASGLFKTAARTASETFTASSALSKKLLEDVKYILSRVDLSSAGAPELPSRLPSARPSGERAADRPATSRRP